LFSDHRRLSRAKTLAAVATAAAALIVFPSAPTRANSDAPSVFQTPVGQMSATQVPAAPTPAEQAAQVKSILKNLDPCAGPLELQSKTGITPCVYVAGEAAFSYGYTSVNIPGTITASGNLGSSFTRNVFGHLDAYPSFAMELGLTAHSQLSIIAPSSIDTNVHFGQASGGASDMQFSYKQMVFANLKSATLLSLEATYEAPVGSMPFAAPGPAYNVKLIFGQGLPKHFGIAGQLPLIYEVASTNAQGQNMYGFQFVPTLLPYWQSVEERSSQSRPRICFRPISRR
jgi:hypothetical protein